MIDSISSRGDRMYLDLLKKTLTGMIYEDPAIHVSWRPLNTYNESARAEGRDWPLNAHTMIGLKRLNSLQECIENVLIDKVPGDFIECGVWRGGACIFMRALLKVYGHKDRMVWLADSFDGFPITSVSEGDRALISQPEQAYLAVPMDEVQHNFELYGLLDDQVGVIPGWFRVSLPSSIKNGVIKQLSILRLDADLYTSTMDALDALYPLLQPGGFCIIDDFNVPMCIAAVTQYREAHGINDKIIDIDGHSVYWRRDA